MRFPDALREAMNGMTQEKLEELSGVGQSTISKCLRGESLPNLTTLEALERALPRLAELRRAVA